MGFGYESGADSGTTNDGSGVLGRIAIWSSATALTSSANLTFASNLLTANSAIFSKGTTGAAQADAADTFLLWSQSKAAFRAGTITDPTYWQNALIGDRSFATGLDNIASGENSFACNNSNQVSGINSFAANSASLVSGQDSSAFGNFQNIYGNFALAGGFSNTIGLSAHYSFIFGQSNTAAAQNVYIFGRNATSAQADTFVANLDGGTRTVLDPNTFYVFGKFAWNTVSPLADIDIRGSLQLAYLAISSNTTISATDHTYFISVDNSAAAITVTLPSAATVGPGRSYRIKCRSDAAVHNVTIQRAGADTIDGAATYVMNVGKAEVGVVSNGGTNWDVN
jgi:hypothetical protein